MLHELVFVLSGFPSDVFLPHPPNQPTTFAIASDFPSLHPAERASLNRLAHLGWIYSQLKDRPVHQGAYAQALSASLDATLDEYRRAILDMECKILDKTYDAGGGIVPTSLLTSALGRWEALLPSLLDFVHELDGSNLRGCRLLDLVLDQARTGHTDYREVMEKAAHRLLQVLYKHMASWMVYGHWVSDDEFFIVREQQGASASNSSGWERRYHLALDKVPAHYISPSVAEAILFVGKAVATVNAMGSSNRMSETQKQQHLQLLLSLRDNHANLRYVVQQIRRSTAEWLFSQVLVGDHGLDKYLTSFRHMFLLGYGDLASNFIVACQAWRRRSIALYPTTPAAAGAAAAAAATVEHGGNSSSSVSDQRSQQQQKKSKSALIFRHQEFNALLVKASIGTDAEDQMDGYSVKVVGGAGEEQEAGALGGRLAFSDLLLVTLRCTLQYEMRWPIDLFLSQTDIDTYTNLWTFLVGLKSVQASLSGLWASLRHGPTDHQGRQLWRVRTAMLFWVDTFWNHVQSNVIRPHYQRLMHIIQDTTSRENVLPDFEDLQAAHHNYLQHITRGCLLSAKDSASIIHRILRLCQKFSRFVEQLAAEEGWCEDQPMSKRRKTTKTAAEIVREWTKTLDGPDMDTSSKLDRVEKDFTYLTERFFTLVSDAPQEVKASGSLDSLLLQLDYNKWYSDTRSRPL